LLTSVSLFVTAMSAAPAALQWRAARTPPQLILPDSGWVTAGDGAHLRITGVPRGARVTLRARRTVLTTRRVDTLEVADTIVVESRAEYAGGGARVIDVDATAPTSGSWSGVDPLGLFWSMRRVTDARRDERLRDRAAIDLTIESRGAVVGRGTLRLRVSARKLVTTVVVADRLVGAFVAPQNARGAPVIIAMHGSEGGDTLANIALATRFAARGYAAFAVSYVAYPWNGGLPGVPTAFDSIDVAVLDRARNWVGAQSSADTSRTGVWGVSKGGEFAMVVAARRRWPRAVIGCVPSDVMWAGYGREPLAGEVLTSWSDSLRRLPAIPYDRYEDVFSGLATPRQVHDRSRAAHPAEALNARIPIERSAAPILLLGSDRDEVWGSGPMVRSLAVTLTRSRPAVFLESTVYPNAGHGICGTGTASVAVFGDTTDVTSVASARAAADAWRRTQAFLARVLPLVPRSGGR